MPQTHRIPSNQTHARWDRSLKPAIEIDSGDVVIFETPEITGGQIQQSSTSNDLINIEFEKIHQISGPVYVRGAMPGDTLLVSVQEITPVHWGWTAILPGFGLLHEDPDFQDPYLHIWDLSSGTHAEFKPGIRIPFEPFAGVMGVFPATDEVLDTIPPRTNGGNIDIKQAQPGSTVMLPVHVEGAGFSLGDVHAAQGDGEVCGSAIECESEVTVQIRVMKDHPMEDVVIRLDRSMPGSWNNKPWMITTAHGPDLFSNSQKAVRYMIDYLVRVKNLSLQEAYVLCSACVDLKISEIVDAPNWIVSASLPMGVFDE